MPRVERSFYADEVHGHRYWTFLSEELPSLVDQFFRVSTRREDTFVAGLSMGGYGAFRWALRQPERFAAAASLSGVLDLADESYRERRLPDIERVFGDREIAGLWTTTCSPCCGAPRPRAARPTSPSCSSRAGRTTSSSTATGRSSGWPMSPAGGAAVGGLARDARVGLLGPHHPGRPRLAAAGRDAHEPEAAPSLPLGHVTDRARA